MKMHEVYPIHFDGFEGYIEEALRRAGAETTKVQMKAFETPEIAEAAMFLIASAVVELWGEILRGVPFGLEMHEAQKALELSAIAYVYGLRAGVSEDVSKALEREFEDRVRRVYEHIGR